MKKIFVLCSIMVCVSCNDDEKAVEKVGEELEFGAVIRTLDIISGEFHEGDLSSFFKIDIEEQDEFDGDLFEAVDVYISFKDKTNFNGNSSTGEVLLKTLPRSAFAESQFGLPRSSLEIGFQEALQAVNLSELDVVCKDQFLVRLDLRLNDGRSFTAGSAESTIIAFDTFYSSPFCYTIQVTSPIDSALFTGMYAMESIQDGPSGPTFVTNEPIEILPSHSNSTRELFLRYITSDPRAVPRRYEFSVVCDEIIFQKNQLSSITSFCLPNKQPILLGPDLINAPANPLDDSVFEIWLVEGYDGWDGECGFGTVSSKIKFTKQ